MTVKPTRVPGIAKVPANIDPQVRQVLESIIEAVEIRLGRKGDPRDRAITLRELIDTGLALQLKAAPFDPNSFGGSNIGFEQPQRSKDPTAPTGFVANAAYSQVNLFWDAAYYEGHNQTEVWSHTSDVLGDATLAGVSTGISMVDPVGSGVSRYYWIRHVNIKNGKGPWNSGSGTLATTATDVAHQLAVLSNAITSSELATSLATPIASIGGFNASITAINGQITALNQTVAALNNTSAWASGQSYSVNDQVTYNGNLFSAKLAHSPSSSSNAPPTTTTSNTTWLFIGAYTSLSAAVGANTSNITELNTVSSSSTSAAARAIAALNATVNDAASGVVKSAANIVQLNTVSASSTSAAAQAIHALNTTVNDPTSGVTATANAFDTVKTLVNHTDDGVAASARKIGTLNSAVFDASGGVQLVSTATLTNNYQTTAQANAAYASSTNLLSAQVANPDGSANQIALSQAMSVQAATNTGLKGQYSVKIDNKGHVTGFGLSSTDTDDGPTSAFIVRADRFAVIDPNSTADGIAADGTGTVTPTADNVPFVIDSGKTYIKSAAILDASITAAQIGSVNANTVSAGTMSADRISGGTIDASTVNIVGTGGTINLSSGAVGANRMVINSDRIEVYQGSDIRVRIGRLT
jgi:hypothetical protein